MMHDSLLGLLVLTVSLGFGRVHAYTQNVSAPIVDIGYAMYQGIYNASSNTTDFLGVRFAAPPVGESFTNCFRRESYAHNRFF